MTTNENASGEAGTGKAFNRADSILLQDDEEYFFNVDTFAMRGNKTDKTDRTDFSAVSNVDFIKGIFGDIDGIPRPLVVSFSGDPNKVGKGAWFGQHWIAGKTSLPENNNNYTSLATFQPDEEGKYRRQKKHFEALHAVMLDDAGVKVELERITLPPSWKIETSPCNFQIGYIFMEPITDPMEADKLLNSIIEAGLCDPGSSGACARLCRLPVAINGKHNADGTPWHCQLKEWNPERRYSVQGIVDGLQIELKESRQQRRTGTQRDTQQADPCLYDVYMPTPDENPVITALKDSGRYKQPLGDGKHDITCPWVYMSILGKLIPVQFILNPINLIPWGVQVSTWALC